MSRRALSLIVAVLALCATRTARADDAADRANDALTAQQFDPGTCDLAPPTAAVPVSTAPPVTWNAFEIAGTLTDPAETVRALFEPTMRRHRALTEDARSDIRKLAASFGYQLVGLGTKDTATGTVAVIGLSPLPMIRRIDVDVKQKFVDILNTPLLDDEIKRRMRVRIGSYLPWTPKERACEIFEEQRRIEEYLRDEGFFEARVAASQNKSGRAVTFKLKVTLGPDYETGNIAIAPREPSLVTDQMIRDAFHHPCRSYKLCFGTIRFRRSTHSADIQKVVDMFHLKGYPAVRVRTDFDPLTSFDRRSHTVRFTVTIDLRRKLEVVFEGHDPNEIAESDLREQLTFDQAASSDDVEANESARALTAFLQGKGYFDARVTFSRERFEWFDRVIYRIEAGKQREVRVVSFVGNHALGEDVLREVVGTREARFSANLFGESTRATSQQLAADVDALAQTYRRAGFREARVQVDAATSPAGLGSSALTAALLAMDRGADLYVRYTIEEGLPTLLAQVQISLGDAEDAITTPDQLALCKLVLADLAELYGEPRLATTADPNRCIATAPNLRFREAMAFDTRDQLKDRLYSHGRPRAKVAYEPRVLGLHRMAAYYRLADVQALTIGKIVIRGNFRTRDAIIRNLLALDEGKPLTKDALANGARRLRNSGLFDAVNVAMPDLDNISGGSVNAVVEVAERYDYAAQVDVEAGYSSYNGAFVTLNPGLKNLFGIGVSLDLKGTIGFVSSDALNGTLKLKQLSGEGTLRFPQWLSEQYLHVPKKLAFQTELTGFHRRQDTPRFGVLTTDGVTLSLLRTWQRQRTAKASARAITLGPHYDFRLRERPVDVLRPAGADDDQTQVPISTRTGSIGAAFEWEQRTDRRGILSPLAPEDGFRFEAQASWAFVLPVFPGGTDTFIKVSAAGTKYWPIGDNLVLRADVRYDQGIPLGGAVLLPEVERFFAGGDSTVRGYEDDRLATEIIQVGVPPLGNLSQIRILPAGGNIRVMSSIDAQLRIWKVFAAGMFVDAGLITNQWSTVSQDDIRPSAGIALFRIVTPFGSLAVERAIPLRPQLGDNPRGRLHLSFAARAQF